MVGDPGGDPVAEAAPADRLGDAVSDFDDTVRVDRSVRTTVTDYGAVEQDEPYLCAEGDAPERVVRVHVRPAISDGKRRQVAGEDGLGGFPRDGYEVEASGAKHGGRP